MEDVLGVYERPYDPAAPGRPARTDYEYKRNGTANIFMFTQPLAGLRNVTVTQRRTKVDWAHRIRDLLNGPYEDVPKVTLLMDNLNTHTLGSLYEAFPAAEAHRLAQRLDIHYTPKHGSLLNIAENELSALSKQCLSRRIGTLQNLRNQISAWERDRNEATVKVNWRFTIDRARQKLHRVYPQTQC
jgi:hypothetical protein